MKRHPSLQPLSRDHQRALLEARAIRWALSGRAGTPREARAGFLATWTSLLARHFAEEEQWIAPLLRRREDAERMRDEHERLRALAGRLAQEDPEAEPDREVLATIARALDDHIRWEERHLFPAFETSASAAELLDIGVRLAASESTRPR